MWQQAMIRLAPRSRGFHLISDEILTQLPFLSEYHIGLLNLFIQHTSASLFINENADPTVREDMERHINYMVPENAPWLLHTDEGTDDMPAHIKCSLFGSFLSIPLQNGQLMLGSWQGIYLGEHRNHGGSRQVIATTHGTTEYD